MIDRGGLQTDTGTGEIQAHRSHCVDEANRQYIRSVGAYARPEWTGEWRFGAKNFGGIGAGIGDELELVVRAFAMRVDSGFQGRVMSGDIRGRLVKDRGRLRGREAFARTHDGGRFPFHRVFGRLCRSGKQAIEVCPARRKGDPGIGEVKRHRVRSSAGSEADWKGSG